MSVTRRAREKLIKILLLLSSLILISCGMPKATTEETSSKKSIQCTSSMSSWHDSETEGDLSFYDSCARSLKFSDDVLYMSLEANTYSFEIINESILTIKDKTFGDTFAVLHSAEKSNNLFRVWTATESQGNIKCTYSYDIQFNSITVKAVCSE